METNRFTFILAGTVALWSCNGSHSETIDTGSAKRMGAFTFKETSYDFGKIQEGDTVTHDFGFTNTGNAPLLISDISTGCGCTVAEWPRKPIDLFPKYV